MKIFREWNIFKHTFAAAIIAIALNYSCGFATIHEAASIGIIGGADGPTSIFISGKGLGLFNYPIASVLFLVAYPGIIAFVIAMLFFKPVRRLLESKNKY